MPSKAQHVFSGSARLCNRCELPDSMHAAKRDRKPYFRNREVNRVRPKPRQRIIGIDGEGVGRAPHLYTYLAAVEEEGRSWSVENDSGLTTEQALNFILSLPARTLVFGYAFVYDLTKICQGLPDKALYDLFHEERRALLIDGRVIYRPVKWRGYKLNYMNRRFTVSLGTKHATIWDIFRFFATKFTGALKDWKIADETRLERMEFMKGKRAEFDKQSKGEIHAYCKEECDYLAKLGRKLIDAHDTAGLPLKHFYGAGSTASAFLERIDIKSKRGEIPDRMRVPIASAFFGGRFENSQIGPVNGPVFNYDISSAYPYHATLLPCLQHGIWSHTRDLAGVRERQLALVHWSIPKIVGNRDWGALPVRSKEGTIAFPLSAKGGWAWGREALAAVKLNPAVDFAEAWVYNTDCDCKPFADIPTYYRERLKLGKDAQGLVLKLGLNSIYGKLAQSRGLNPPYQSWVWAGNITSGCRAQLIESLLIARKPSDVLMFATDGVWSRAKLDLPRPVDTGTFDCAKPLGGWEEKIFDRGVFCVRPGIYFPLQPTDAEIEKVRARGLGRRLLYEQWPRIVEAWERRLGEVELHGVQRFIGAKTGFGYGPKSGIRRRAEYGEWVAHPVSVSFSPRPKRESVNANGSLKAWDYFDYDSVPYSRALLSPESILLKLAELIAEEQRDADFTEVD